MQFETSKESTQGLLAAACATEESTPGEHGKRIGGVTGSRMGFSDGLAVKALRFEQDGNVEWHVTVKRDLECTFKDYFVTAEHFYRVSRTILGEARSFQIGELVPDLDPEEKDAVLKAIRNWEERKKVSANARLTTLRTA